MTAVEWFFNEIKHILPNDFLVKYEQAQEMEKEQMIEFAKLHVQTALKAVENEMILQASSVKHWYLPETIK